MILRKGKSDGSIVSSINYGSLIFPDGEAEDMLTKAYGGYIVADTVAPQFRSLFLYAPELWLALHDLVNAIDENEPINGILAEARKLLSKASGGRVWGDNLT